MREIRAYAGGFKMKRNELAYVQPEKLGKVPKGPWTKCRPLNII
jgi:hypothetical protein